MNIVSELLVFLLSSMVEVGFKRWQNFPISLPSHCTLAATSGVTSGGDSLDQVPVFFSNNKRLLTGPPIYDNHLHEKHYSTLVNH